MSKKSKLVKEFIWLIAILGIATLIEFIIIETLDLHPVLSIKIQGLIGLMLIGYGIRMATRIWKSYHKQADPTSNGKEVLE